MEHTTVPDYAIGDAMVAARVAGADAAAAAVASSWVMMSDEDARSILDGVDPAVLDRYPEPNLSGEFADDPTPASLAYDVGIDPADVPADVVDRIAAAWEEGRDSVWHAALEVVALRTLGRVADALRIEREVEATIDTLRTTPTVIDDDDTRGRLA